MKRDRRPVVCGYWLGVGLSVTCLLLPAAEQGSLEAASLPAARTSRVKAGTGRSSTPAAKRRSRRPAAEIPPWNASDWHVGPYIWTAETHDLQTIRLWRAFDIPRAAVVTAARLRVVADNGCVVSLDGRELGVGSDYHYMTEYDLGEILTPGRHVLAIRAFNETHEAGVAVGLEVDFSDQPPLAVMSDDSWRIVPAGVVDWERRSTAADAWEPAVVIAAFGAAPWIEPPLRLTHVMVKPPTKPVVWEQTWFAMTAAAVGIVAGLASVVLATRLVTQSRARNMLDRERSRIARDIHDEIGAGLTQLILQAEVTRTELPLDAEARERLESFGERARSLAGALDELVWAVNSRRDTLRDFVAYACKHVRRFLEPTAIRCRLDVAEDLPEVACDMPVRRNLLLAVKEAVNNSVKYSGAAQLCLRVERRPPLLVVVVEDDGCGFDPTLTEGSGNGLANLAARMQDIGGTCRITAAPGAGCRVELELPLAALARAARPPLVGFDLYPRTHPVSISESIPVEARLS